jgi:hypothetical protein
VRSSSRQDPSLLEDDLDDVVLVCRVEDSVEDLLRRTFEDTLGTLSGREDVERVDDVNERDSAAQRRNRGTGKRNEEERSEGPRRADEGLQPRVNLPICLSEKRTIESAHVM